MVALTYVVTHNCKFYQARTKGWLTCQNQGAQKPSPFNLFLFFIKISPEIRAGFRYPNFSFAYYTLLMNLGDFVVTVEGAIDVQTKK